MIIAAILISLCWLVLTIDWFLGIRKVPVLSAGEPELRVHPPLSIVIPALNEGRALETSLRSVVEQDYPNFDILVLNDRSTDETGEILGRMKETHPKLEAVHIEALPEGWLGKNNALHTGAQRTQGEWLLFTDADVQLKPQAVSAALAYASRHQVDHLTAVPYMLARSPWLKAFVSAFMLLFSFGVLRASAPATKAYVGLGAFNLLRRSVYDNVGGHQAIAMRPDDDMKLGKLVHRAGYKQVTVLATDLLCVEWYRSVCEAVRGLNKNAFAGVEYSLPLALTVTLSLLVANVLPFVAVFLTTGPVQILYLFVLLNIGFIYVASRGLIKVSAWYALLHPVGTLILAYAVVESAIKATWSGGIRWRGTFYSLEQLRKNKV